MTDVVIPHTDLPHPSAAQVTRPHGGMPVAVDPVPWWAGRVAVDDPAHRRPVIVAVGVDGEAHCRCGTTPVGDTPACTHIAAVRAHQASPLEAAARHLLRLWVIDEAWRGGDAAAAHWARRAMRILLEADVQSACRDQIREYQARRLRMTTVDAEADIADAVDVMRMFGRAKVRDYADDAALRRSDADHAAHEDSGGWARVLADSDRAAHDAALLRGDTTISEETP